MKNLTFCFLACTIFLIFSCERKWDHSSRKASLVSLKNTGAGLQNLTDEWEKDTSYYEGIILPDSTWDIINPEDIVRSPYYEIVDIYRYKTGKGLTIRKGLWWNPKTKELLREIDLYEKQLNNSLQSQLTISYDFQERKFDADMIDTIASLEKRKANRAKLDSMYAHAEANNAYICGTAAGEILMEGIPLTSERREIDKEEALKIAKIWMEK